MVDGNHPGLRTNRPTMVLSPVWMIVFLLLGCGSQDTVSLEADLSDIAAETGEVEDALGACVSTLESWEMELSQTEEKLAALKEKTDELVAVHPELAALTVTVLPNPIVCGADEDGMWRWTAAVTANRSGFFLKSMARRTYRDGNLLQDRTFDEDHVAQYSHLDGNYLPLYGTCVFRFGLNCQSVDEIGIVFTAIDDDGNVVESQEVRVPLIR